MIEVSALNEPVPSKRKFVNSFGKNVTTLTQQPLLAMEAARVIRP
jgi:hypothetical protein